MPHTPKPETIEGQTAKAVDPATHCSSCSFQAQMGITLLDAKYLDPKCWKGCQGLVHAHRIEALIIAGDRLRELASMGHHASFADLQAWDSAARTNARPLAPADNQTSTTQ